MRPSARTATAGRPRAFDTEKALDQAMRVFWKQGYEGTSLLDLTAAMGINRPSLYAAFGDKESLFRKAVDRYSQLTGAAFDAALTRPTARASVQSILDLIVGKPTPNKIRGCFLVQGALACGESAEPLRRELAARRASTEIALKARFDRAIVENDLPPKTDSAALAKFFATFIHGLTVQLAGGAKRQELHAAAQVALSALP
jgi:AcrR family transcriptional regulator